MTQDARAALRLAAGHRHFDHRAAPFVAIENGYFDDAGIGRVTIEATGEDDRTVEALLAGRIDIALDISPAKVMAAHARGEPLVIIGSMANGVGQVLIGRKGLRAIEDLRGRRINVVEQGSGVDWHPLRIALARHGIDPDTEVELVYKAPYPLFDNARRTFEADLADARMILHAEAEAGRAAGYPILLDFLAEYPDDYPQRTIVTTRDFLAADAALVEAFLTAMIRGYRFLRDPGNYAQSMAIVKRNIHDEGLGFPPGITEHFMKDHYFGFKQMPADGGFRRSSLQRYIDEEVILGRAAPGIEPDAISDMRAVEAANAALTRRTGGAAV